MGHALTTTRASRRSWACSALPPLSTGSIANRTLQNEPNRLLLAFFSATFHGRPHASLGWGQGLLNVPVNVRQGKVWRDHVDQTADVRRGGGRGVCGIEIEDLIRFVRKYGDLELFDDWYRGSFDCAE